MPKTIKDVIFEQRVREKAYYLSEQRGFEPGHEMADWILAEEIVKREGVRRRNGLVVMRTLTGPTNERRERRLATGSYRN